MGYIKCISNIVLVILIVSSCTAQSQPDDHKEYSIIGEWVCVKNTWRNITEYGENEVEEISKSTLTIDSQKVFLKGVNFIDTCYYESMKNIPFFDREEKESSYIIDGALAVLYSDEELSSFRRIELIDGNEYNCLSTMYLNRDTLILNYCGGITFFLIKKPFIVETYSGIGSTQKEINLPAGTKELELEYDFYSAKDHLVIKNESGTILFDSNMITTNGELNKKINVETLDKVYIEIKSSSESSKWKLKVSTY